MRATARTVLAALLFAACSSEEVGNTIAFDIDAAENNELAGVTYWAFPFPSDLRLTAEGLPNLEGFPNPRNLPIVDDLLSAASTRKGWNVMPTAWFQFTEAAPEHSIDHVFLADAGADALLVDIDPSSDERGSLFPIVADTLDPDPFTGKNLVSVSVRPGIVLRGHTRYAFVLRRGFAPDAARAPAFADLAGGGGSSTAKELYAPLWDALDELGVSRDDVLAATVFTTGDEVEMMRERSEAIRMRDDVVISNVAFDHALPETCVLTAQVEMPQYQKGRAPFSTEGRFEVDANNVPVKQGSMSVPMRITIPRREMPAAGWPLWQYFHGSGGASFDLVDEGMTPAVGGAATPGEGPGVVVARRGIAAASTAMPVNGERLPGANDYDYLNFNNLSALPYTFQQGVFEQRMLLDALLELRIPAATLAACSGAALPVGATEHRFNPNNLTAGGHSMGGMYTNMIGAVEPRYGALTPFGAGGFWSMMILDTAVVEGARDLLASILGVDGEVLTFAHPTLGMLGLGWEVAEPGASMARIARRPLPGLTERHVYEPIGMDDRYFPNPVFDAAALAYGNRQAGDIVWPGTQDALRTDGLDGIMEYPVKANRTDGSQATTAVVVQYLDGGIVDAHQIYRQLPEVRYQYGCFLETYLRDGVPTVPAPAAESAACP
jgi:hypothetical protein